MCGQTAPIATRFLSFTFDALRITSSSLIHISVRLFFRTYLRQGVSQNSRRWKWIYKISIKTLFCSDVNKSVARLKRFLFFSPPYKTSKSCAVAAICARSAFIVCKQQETPSLLCLKVSPNPQNTRGPQQKNNVLLLMKELHKKKKTNYPEWKTRDEPKVPVSPGNCWPHGLKLCGLLQGQHLTLKGCCVTFFVVVVVVVYRCPHSYTCHHWCIMSSEDLTHFHKHLFMCLRGKLWRLAILKLETAVKGKIAAAPGAIFVCLFVCLWVIYTHTNGETQLASLWH